MKDTTWVRDADELTKSSLLKMIENPPDHNCNFCLFASMDRLDRQRRRQPYYCDLHGVFTDYRCCNQNIFLRTLLEMV